MAEDQGVWVLGSYDYIFNVDSIHVDEAKANAALAKQGYGLVVYVPFEVEIRELMEGS